jgi:arylformamidase
MTNILSDEAHEAAFNPQRSVADSQAPARRRAPLNEAALALPGRIPDIAFGPGPLHGLDLYRPEGPGPFPVHGFLHGGYWRAQDKRNFAFIAPPLLARGVMVAVLNYDLCPAVTLDGTVESALAGVEWLLRNAAARGGDPARVTFSGHSAGAHLLAAALAADWPARGLPADAIKGALLISGIYDPRPAMRTTVNAEIGLTPELSARHDYAALPPRVRCPAWVMAGGAEPPEWVEQSLGYARHLRRHGLPPGLLVAPGYNHFDIMDQYAEPDSDVSRLLARLIG